ncbi:MAG TPA: efflux RND transporter periplasmic adaptor subunit [Thermoanaerobaculia bacterium]|nr:efflux RND transporter periplasmic adaptor subunit [Thermoanaerobaculia bacterium]
MTGLTACSDKPGKAAEATPAPGTLTIPPEQRPRIGVAAVADSTYRRTLETTGTVAFDQDQSTTVLSPISGPVSRLLVSVGASVNRTEPLAAVASPDFAAAVGAYRKADATARNTKRIADLDTQLFANDAISRREMEQAQTDALAAESDRDAAMLALRSLGLEPQTIDDLRQGKQVHAEGLIRSPITGIVVEKLITPGQLLQAGATPCFTVSDLSTVWVMANVFESDLPFVRAGDAADIHAGVSPDIFAGKVDYVAAMVDPNTRAIAVRIVVPNPKRLLKKDLYVRVGIHSHRESRGILAPVSAVLRDDENLPFVFVENADQSFARRRVTLGSQIGDRYEIPSGLRDGERVVTEGGLFLQFSQSQ